MNTNNYGTYGSETQSFGGFVPVWKYIDNMGIEEGGGKLKVVSSFATEYPVGTIIPVGSPVHLSAPGGDLTVLKTLEVLTTFDSSTATTVVFKGAGIALLPAVGEFFMAAPATVGTSGTGFEVKTAVVDASGNITMDISVGAAGAATAGDIFVQTTAAGAGKYIKLVPTGLLRREIYIGAGVTTATGASVFNGTILVDRIPPISASMKAALPQIKFEQG